MPRSRRRRRKQARCRAAWARDLTPTAAARKGACGKGASVRITAAAPLVLGSASPRRRELLATLGVPFVVQSASADEAQLPGEAARTYVARVTLAKLGAVRALDLPPAAAILV